MDEVAGSEIASCGHQNPKASKMSITETLSNLLGSGSKIETTDHLISFILLRLPAYSQEVFLKNINSDWDFDFVLEKELEDAFIAEWDDYEIIIKLKKDIVDGHQVADSAALNVTWKEVRNVVHNHAAHLQIMLRSETHTTREIAITLAKINASLGLLDNSIAILMNSALHEPGEYKKLLDFYNNRNEFPLHNVMALNMYRSPQDQKLLSAFCYGLHKFGQYNIEIVDKDLDPKAVRTLVGSCALHLVNEAKSVKKDFKFQASLSKNEKVAVKMQLTDGLAIPDKTFKIVL